MSRRTRRARNSGSRLRSASYVLLVAGIAILIIGTGAFSAMSADRGFNMNVTDDKSALLGYEKVNNQFDTGKNPFITYTNQFGHDLDSLETNITAKNNGVRVLETDAPEELPEGEQAHVDVTLRCLTSGEVDLHVETVGSGDGVNVSLDRTHTVICNPPIEGVTFRGVGNADVHATPEYVEATVWLTDANPGQGNADNPGHSNTNAELNSETIQLNTSKSVQPQLPEHVRNDSMAAIEFPEEDIAFFHPGWNGDNHENPRTGDGVPLLTESLDADEVRDPPENDED